MNEAVPPHSLDAEEHVLGACLISERAMEKCADILVGQAFYRPSHGAIFDAMLAMHSRGAPVGATLLVDELTKLDNLETAGGDGRIYELSALAPSVSNVAHHANIVRDTWLARELVATGREIQRLGMERPGEIGELVAKADKQLLRVQMLQQNEDKVFTGRQLIADFRAKLANPEEEEIGNVNTPFSFLSPLLKSRLYVLGGYSGDGKTAGAIQFLAAACEAGARVGFHTIEMSKSDMTDRLITTFGFDYHDVRTGRIPERHRDRLEDALKKIEGWDWELLTEKEVDPAVIRRSQRKGKYDLLIVDHLQRMPIKDRRHAREELEENIRRITNTACEFEIPLLLLSQLSRGEKRNPFPRPTMADLKGSGAIEQEASFVWFVWRPRDPDTHRPGADAEFVIEKNRYGPTGSRNLHFRASQVRFSEVA